MTDTGKTGVATILLPDDPPNVVVKWARSQARALKRSVYVYSNRSNWTTTTDLHEPPSDAAVWMISAN